MTSLAQIVRSFLNRFLVALKKFLKNVSFSKFQKRSLQICTALFHTKMTTKPEKVKEPSSGEVIASAADHEDLNNDKMTGE